ncbi:MAG: disulfide reductase [Deltaproteobacteria bacterium]|nr:disulfide reductase [Deltaproteobacteria bacterium]
MTYALFLGCQIPIRLQQYETSSRAVLERLGVELMDIEEFNCCGYPLRNIDFKTFLLASARNLALAEKKNLNVMTLCQCCYGALKKADFLLKENPSLKKEVNAVLQQEGVSYEGKIEIKHLLSVLDQEVGVETIRKKVEKPFEGLNIAAHYGCHALRPSQVVQFDDPGNPSIFDRLVEVTGAKSIDWLMRLECCGAPLLGSNDELSTEMTLKKLNNGQASGADYLCTACTYCQIQFDTVQQMILSRRGSGHPLPSILYPQLLGLSMGIPPEPLGLQMNKIPIREIGS